MKRRRALWALLYAGILSALGSSAATSASAQTSETMDCLKAHEAAQLSRLAGELLASSQRLEECAAKACPALVQLDCRKWGDELRTLIPQVSLVALGDSGRLSTITIVIDGHISDDQSSTIRLDPGTHQIKIINSSGDFQEISYLAVKGETTEVLTFDFRSPPSFSSSTPPPLGVQGALMTSETPAHPEAPSKTEVADLRSPPPISSPGKQYTDESSTEMLPAYILLGVSAVSLGVGIGFGLDALSEQNSGESVCSPNCDSEVSERVNRSATVADIALTTSAISAIGALAFYVFAPRPKRSPIATQHAQSITPKFHLSAHADRLIIEGSF